MEQVCQEQHVKAQLASFSQEKALYKNSTACYYWVHVSALQCLMGFSEVVILKSTGWILYINIIKLLQECDLSEWPESWIPRSMECRITSPLLLLCAFTFNWQTSKNICTSVGNKKGKDKSFSVWEMAMDLLEGRIMIMHLVLLNTIVDIRC